jgi:hypothetical protein
LREALARTDHDFILADEPRRKPRAAQTRPVAPARPLALANLAAAGKPRVSLAFLTRRPGRTIAAATLSALVTGIILNAVMFQKGPHPAPLFGGPRLVATLAKPAVPTPVASLPAAPAPAPRPVSLPQGSPSNAAPANAPVVATARAPEPQATPRGAAREVEPASPPPRKDPIAALIRGEGVADAVAPPARVAAVQKALVMAGFVLRTDGVMGATTRQALEHFEQERNLPVTGDLSPRTLRELASQSGVAIP